MTDKEMQLKEENRKLKTELANVYLFIKDSKIMEKAFEAWMVRNYEKLTPVE